MADKGHTKLKIDRTVERILREYCGENNIDRKTFVEEAIMEKIEVERAAGEAAFYEDLTEGQEEEGSGEAGQERIKH